MCIILSHILYFLMHSTSFSLLLYCTCMAKEPTLSCYCKGNWKPECSSRCCLCVSCHHSKVLILRKVRYILTEHEWKSDPVNRLIYFLQSVCYCRYANGFLSCTSDVSIIILCIYESILIIFIKLYHIKYQTDVFCI